MFTAACRGSRPALSWQDNACWPLVSTLAPQRQAAVRLCGTHAGAPTRRATIMRRVSLSSGVPRLTIDSATHQSAVDRGALDAISIILLIVL